MCIYIYIYTHYSPSQKDSLPPSETGLLPSGCRHTHPTLTIGAPWLVMASHGIWWKAVEEPSDFSAWSLQTYSFSQRDMRVPHRKNGHKQCVCVCGYMYCLRNSIQTEKSLGHGFYFNQIQIIYICVCVYIYVYIYICIYIYMCVCV